MKLSFHTILLVVTLVFWIGLGLVVLDFTLGWGTTTLRWPNPAASTASWTWDAAEATPTIIEPRSGQWLRVTLPRGFVAATLEVQTVDSAELVLRAEARDREMTISQASGGSIHSLSFSWTSLVARGKTYRFRVENPSDAAVHLRSIRLITTR